LPDGQKLDLLGIVLLFQDVAARHPKHVEPES
jgi:hypothetical protein